MWGHRAGNPRAGFSADPLMAVLVIATAACGIATGLASGIGIFVKRERSLLLFLTFFARGVRAAVCGRGALRRFRPPLKFLSTVPANWHTKHQARDGDQ